VSFPTLLPLPVTLDDDFDAPTLWQFADVPGPGKATRNIHVALPAGYEPSARRRYPVVYLQDGQNLFDPATAYADHWGMLETLAARGAKRVPIVVGIPNLGIDRLREYSPFDDIIHGEGGGAAYLAFVRYTVKPLVDRAFRTRTSRASTTIAGSSMGGLLAMYGLVAGASTFGSAWVMSPALWYADGAIYDWLERQPTPVGRLWLDVGLGEGIDAVHDVRRMRDMLVARGWRLDDTLHYREDPDGDHDEGSWRRRIQENFRALMGLME